ncbi:unnamed protein product [Vicia faba]|uniref:Methyltransferase n=1 Tax=Vicia faba TaxID=3906 RepID=A0AAV1AAT5_VICFA|nr:unnamed protein product [Vicia faba]
MTLLVLLYSFYYVLSGECGCGRIRNVRTDIAWGKQTHAILDVGYGVARFDGFLFQRDVLAMSFALKDEHEVHVQFALERGIPAISIVMDTKRLLFPARVFDVVHCAHYRVFDIVISL